MEGGGLAGGGAQWGAGTGSTSPWTLHPDTAGVPQQAAGASKGALLGIWVGVVAAGCLAQRSRPSFIVSYFQAPSTNKQWNGNQMVLKSRTTRPETALPRTRAVTTPQPHSPGARKHTR